VRMLFTAQPAAGHVNPMLPIARASRDAGHDVRFAAPADAIPWIEAAGIEAVQAGASQAAVRAAHPDSIDHVLDPRWFPDVIFARFRPRAMVPDLLRVIDDWRPDVLVRELSEYGAAIVSELTGIPNATIEIAPNNPEQLAWAFGDGLAETRAVFGLPLDPDLSMLFRYLGLAFGPARLDAPGASAVGTRHYLRPAAFDASVASDAPAWLEELGPLPVVHATLGTSGFNRAVHVLRTVVDALSNDDLQLIVTVGPTGDPATLGPVPASVRVERYIPHTALFPHCRVVIAHGGRGTMMNAIRHGIPQLVLPQGADQFANAEICVREGIGSALMPDEVTPAAVRSAVRALIDDDATRTRIRSLNDEMDHLPGLAHGVTLLERLARERGPIPRTH